MSPIHDIGCTFLTHANTTGNWHTDPRREPHLDLAHQIREVPISSIVVTVPKVYSAAVRKLKICLLYKLIRSASNDQQKALMQHAFDTWMRWAKEFRSFPFLLD